MKRTLILLAFLCMAHTAQAQPQNVYQCIRPDGTVVCTVRDTTGDPSVTCNYECVDCNMVCVARLRLMEGNGEMLPVLPPAVGGERRPPSSAVETPQYCRSRYQQCVAKCKSDPDNRTSYDVEACISSCESWFSGCGMKP
ncbi:MAG: hypothetical protein ACLGSA_11455 [Acidobacteriota bacterium]